MRAVRVVRVVRAMRAGMRRSEGVTVRVFGLQSGYKIQRCSVPCLCCVTKRIYQLVMVHVGYTMSTSKSKSSKVMPSHAASGHGKPKSKIRAAVTEVGGGMEGGREEGARNEVRESGRW